MIVACALAIATWLCFPDDTSAARRVRALRARDRPQRPAVNAVTTRAACILAGIAAVLLVPGAVGWGVGAAVALAGPVVLARLSTRSDAERDDALAKQAPVIAELLAACVASGATMRDATAVVADALDDPGSDATRQHGARVLRSVVASIDLGASPAAAWSEATRHPALAPIARAIIRSSSSGAPLAHVLAALADDVRRERRIAIEVAARAAGVRAVAPLAVCFLPAFLLLSVVPIVVDLGTSMLSTQG